MNYHPALRNIVLIILLITLSKSLVIGQTTLTPGDIAIIGIKTGTATETGNDAVKLLTMVDLSVNTTFIVTDNNWNSTIIDWNCSNDEFGLQVTVTSAISAGSVIYIDVSAASQLITSSTGSLTNTDLGNPWGTNYGLSSGGDNVFIVQGSRAVPSFIYAIKNGSAFTNGPCSNNDNTGLPAALTLGTTAIVMSSSQEQCNYPCSNTLTGNKAALLTSIGNSTNWTNTKGSLQIPAWTWSSSTCSFNVTIAASPEINVQGNSTNIPDGNTSTSLTDNTDFGTIVLGNTISRTFVIQNTGTASLNVSSINFTGINASDFLVTSPTFPLSIGAGSSQTITVSCTPVAVGPSIATINIHNNDSDEGNYDFTIRGISTSPEINLQGNSINIPDGNTSTTQNNNTYFGTVTLGNSISKNFVIQNTGTASLNVSNITFTGPNASNFLVTAPSFPISINAGASQTITVSYTPVAEGPSTATMNINNNDSDEGVYDFSIRGATIIRVTSTVTNAKCKSYSDGKINYSIIGGNPPYNFSWSNGVTGVENNQLTNLILSGLAAGNYTLNITDNLGEPFSQNFPVTEPSLLSPPISPSITSCEGAVTLTASNSPLDYIWHDVNGNSLDTTSGSFMATLTKDSTFKVSSIDLNGCNSSMTTVNITVDKLPKGNLSGNDTILVGQSPNQLTLNNIYGNIQQWQQAVDNIFSNPVTVPSSGINTYCNLSGVNASTFYRVKIQSGVCPVYFTNAIEIRVNIAHTCNPDSVRIFQNEVITSGSSVLTNDSDPNGDLLHVIPISNYTTLKGGKISIYQDGTFDYTPPANFSQWDSIHFTVCDGYDVNVQYCIESYLVILVKRPFIIYTSLTPNGDNINDEWVIDGIENFPVNSVTIFNRWGQLVFESTNYSNNGDRVWKGKHHINNTDLPEGTYFYQIDLSDGNDPITGYVVLKR